MKYRVCPTCHGEGKVVNRAVSVWTEDDRLDDPEGFESMMHGDYDVACYECGGRRVVTRKEHRNYHLERQDDFLMLREQGVYPGSSDYF